jgi:arginyl-tRNA synthetase
MVKLPEGKFSGRAGTWVGFSADDLMNEGMEKAEERMKEASLADRKKLVNAAIKYSFLKVGASKEVTFEWERALSMEGDSGPYLLYSFVRAMKILEKSTAKESFKAYNQDEKNLIFKMSQFSEAVESASKQYEPCIVANYLLELASMFHTYYAKHKVVGSPEEGERRAIVKSFANIMETGLGLLGIETLGEM